MNRRFGWRPDLPDRRDTSRKLMAMQLPESVDLRDSCPKKIFDQGTLGCCTACALSAAYEFELIKKGKGSHMPSQLFIYYMERYIEDNIDKDSGAMMRTGMKVLAKYGACTDKLWPFKKKEFKTEPPLKCFQEAEKYQLLTYNRIGRSLAEMKECLASGHPFVFGFSIYDSLMTESVAKTGVVPLPLEGEELHGGHAVLAVGYSDADQRFIVRNSWGVKWGMDGYFTIPYDYLMDENLSSAFWMMEVIEG
jgi:C1A family cysteine protease